MSGSSVSSNSAMNISANTGPSSDPIATPSVCTKIFLMYVKWTFWYTFSDLVIDVSSSL